jgi:hypothetical protein
MRERQVEGGSVHFACKYANIKTIFGVQMGAHR